METDFWNKLTVMKMVPDTRSAYSIQQCCHRNILQCIMGFKEKKSSLEMDLISNETLSQPFWFQHFQFG